MVEPVRSLPLDKSSAVAPQLGPSTGLRLLSSVCPFWLIAVLAFVSSVKRAPNPSWMPKSCTVLKGLQFLIYLVIALDLHCLPSIYLSPSMRCLLHWGLPKTSQHCNCAEAAAWFCLLLVVLCSAIQRLVWAQRPGCCALSWQLTAIVTV